jgi:UDP-glucose-4-epimerase GalE
VLSSTCATYGEPIDTPIAESHPQRPINSYGETKLAIERALPHFERAHGMSWVALRYFNAAGADPEGEIGEDHAPEIHVIPRAIEAATGGRGLQVFGDDYPTPDGTCLRDYIHVSDLADAHLLAIEATAPDDSRTDEPLVCNLGNGDGFSIREVVAAAEAVVGRAIPSIVGPRRAGDPPVLVARSTRASDVLGWRPVRPTLDEMVGSAWRWRQAWPGGYPD